MRSSRFLRSLFFLIAPVVMVMALLAVWLGASAAVENYRVGTVSQQVIAAVARAREMHITIDAVPERAQAALMDRLLSFDGMVLLVDSDSRQPEDPQRGIENPWGLLTRIFVYPSAQALRFEVPLTAPACRKMLLFYAKDSVSLGLQRVDSREHLPSALWGLVYEAPLGATTGGGIPVSAIETGCQGSGNKVVSLTFKL